MCWTSCLSANPGGTWPSAFTTAATSRKSVRWQQQCAGRCPALGAAAAVAAAAVAAAVAAAAAGAAAVVRHEVYCSTCWRAAATTWSAFLVQAGAAQDAGRELCTAVLCVMLCVMLWFYNVPYCCRGRSWWQECAVHHAVTNNHQPFMLHAHRGHDKARSVHHCTAPHAAA